jgi:hypothetical protein
VLRRLGLNIHDKTVLHMDLRTWRNCVELKAAVEVS